MEVKEHFSFRPTESNKFPLFAAIGILGTVYCRCKRSWRRSSSPRERKIALVLMGKLRIHQYSLRQGAMKREGLGETISLTVWHTVCTRALRLSDDYDAGTITAICHSPADQCPSPVLPLQPLPHKSGRMPWRVCT